MEKKQLIVIAGVGVISAAAGFGGGYILAKKKYAAIAEEEIESVRYAYAKNAEPKPDLNTLRRENFEEPAEQLPDDVILSEGYISLNEETDAELFRQAHGRVPSTYELIQMGQGVSPQDAIRRTRNDDVENIGLVETEVAENLFETHAEPDPEDLGLGTEPEDAPRTPDRPYVIATEEWYLNETDYDQITLTYWADDDVLADDANRMITAVDEVVGATNLHRFGFKSDNPDIVYVRNERIKADYEITKDERNFSEVVHNTAPGEVNNTGVPRRMRSNDE